MGDQEKPIWEGNALGASVEIFVCDDGWHVYEVNNGPRRELGDTWKPLVYSAAIASLVPERDKLRAENEALRARLARLEWALNSLVCEENEDLAEVLMDDRSDKSEPSWQDAINEHRRRIENARAALKGSDNGQTEA